MFLIKASRLVSFECMQSQRSLQLKVGVMHMLLFSIPRGGNAMFNDMVTGSRCAVAQAVQAELTCGIVPPAS